MLNFEHYGGKKYKRDGAQRNAETCVLGGKAYVVDNERFSGGDGQECRGASFVDSGRDRAIAHQPQAPVPAEQLAFIAS